MYWEEASLVLSELCFLSYPWVADSNAVVKTMATRQGGAKNKTPTGNKQTNGHSCQYALRVLAVAVASETHRTVPSTGVQGRLTTPRTA